MPYSVSQYEMDDVMEGKEGVLADDGIHYVFTSDMTRPFGKLKNFDLFVKGLNGFDTLHEKRTYMIRLHLEKLSGK